MNLCDLSCARNLRLVHHGPEHHGHTALLHRVQHFPYKEATMGNCNVHLQQLTTKTFFSRNTHHYGQTLNCKINFSSLSYVTMQIDNSILQCAYRAPRAHVLSSLLPLSHWVHTIAFHCNGKIM